MTMYYTLDTVSGTLVQMLPGEFTSTSDLTEAINGAEALTSLHERKFRHVTLEQYVEFTASQTLGLRNAQQSIKHLTDAITEHLDAVKGAMDVEEFIEEHQDLADAIGYEFEEETTFRITLEVVVKHQMGKTDLDDALDIEVKEFSGYGDSGIIDIDVTDIDIRKQ